MMESQVVDSRCSSSIANHNKRTENIILKQKSRDKKQKINQTFTWGSKIRTDQFSLKTMKQMIGMDKDMDAPVKHSHNLLLGQS